MGNRTSARLDVSHLAPVRVGPHALPNAVLLAPMSGVTDVAFRHVALAWGAGLVITEMVASEHLVTEKHNARRKARGGDCKPFVIQLAGCEARWMSEGARVAEALGADIIDINMGCPAREVTGKLSGSALMRDLDHAASLIEAVIGAVKVPVTLKMRLGWDHASLNAPELARLAEAAGVQLLTVHARTRCQFFKGEADWRLVRQRQEMRCAFLSWSTATLSIPPRARAALEASGADAVMVGRGAYGAPVDAGQDRSEPGNRERSGVAAAIANKATIAAAHVEAILEQDGPAHGLRNARKHIGWYLASSGRPPEAVKDWRRRLCTSENARDVLAGLATFYAQAREAA